MTKMSNEEFRELILRNNGICDEITHMPVIYKEEFNLKEIKLIGCHNTKQNDTCNKDCGVHFYKWDDKLECYYKNPYKYIEKFRQYKFLLTPDFSFYLCSNPHVQMFNVFRSRWVGSFFQRKGCIVYPGAGWGDKDTFSWCFSGLPNDGTLSISTLGTFTENKKAFLDGYFELLKQKNPQNIICYGKVHPEMEHTCNIISCLHEAEIINEEKDFNQTLKYYANLLFPREEIYG